MSAARWRPSGRAESDHALREHLIDSRLAGLVATPPRSTIANCRKLSRGDVDYTFGLPDAEGTPLLEALEAVVTLCGGDPGGAELDGPGFIDPDRALVGIDTHRRRLAGVAASAGAVLLATGHPSGLLGHYMTLARELQAAGCDLLTPLDDVFLPPYPSGRERGIRFTDGVAAEFDGASLRHTHKPDLMEAMLDDLGAETAAIDLVVADHGLAGAAIARGLPTISIADVNDPALPLAQVRGRTDGVLCIDDNLAPRHFLAVTEAMLAW